MLNDLLKRIADAGRQLRGSSESRSPELIDLCESVLRGKGEATGMASAIDVLDGYRALKTDAKARFFDQLLARFSGDPQQIQKALERFAKGPAAARPGTAFRIRAADPGAGPALEPRAGRHRRARRDAA